MSALHSGFAVNSSVRDRSKCASNGCEQVHKVRSAAAVAANHLAGLSGVVVDDQGVRAIDGFCAQAEVHLTTPLPFGRIGLTLLNDAVARALPCHDRV
jgi:hypothetical protein